MLDRSRLGKQRVETMQIYNALTQPGYGWKNHPAVKMWKGYEHALLVYGMAMCREWSDRKYDRGTTEGWFRTMLDKHEGPLISPPWLADAKLHRSHQSNLVRKDPTFYRIHFPDVPDNLPYQWPVLLGGTYILMPGAKPVTA